MNSWNPPFLDFESFARTPSDCVVLTAQSLFNAVTRHLRDIDYYSGDIVSNERARMSPSLVEALVIAKDNFEFARRLQGVENSELVE